MSRATANRFGGACRVTCVGGGGWPVRASGAAEFSGWRVSEPAGGHAAAAALDPARWRRSRSRSRSRSRGVQGLVRTLVSSILWRVSVAPGGSGLVTGRRSRAAWPSGLPVGSGWSAGMRRHSRRMGWQQVHRPTHTVNLGASTPVMDWGSPFLFAQPDALRHPPPRAG